MQCISADILQSLHFDSLSRNTIQHYQILASHTQPLTGYYIGHCSLTHTHRISTLQVVTMYSTPSASSPLSHKPHPLAHQRSGSLSSHTLYTPSSPSSSSSSSSEKLSLPHFVSRYHKSLPLSIRVCRGYCGPSEDTSISEGDHFNVHFVKHTTIVLVEMENGYQYNVPLNSAVPFAVLFDPHKNLAQASKGYTFTKVADLLQLPSLPHVVRARKAHTSSNSENSIAANELLIVRSAVKKMIGKNQLKVFSLTDKREKTLSESCIGHFSTKPRDVCLYLPDIVKHAPDIFPCRAILFANKDSLSSIPSKLSSSVVTLMHHSIETSLVVTSALEEEGEGGEAKMLDIPIDLNIQVRVASVTEVEAQRLARSTAYLYDHFNPRKLQSYVPSARSRGMQETQNLLYQTVRHDHRGIRITRPESIFISSRQDSTDNSRSSSSPGSYPRPNDLYDDIMPQGDSHYMSPRPAGAGGHMILATPTDEEGPPLPDRNNTHKRTPGYSYVDMEDFRRCAPIRATRAVVPSAASVGSGERASGDSSFGSTGSGGAVVERSLSEATASGRGGGVGDYSQRSSYSEGDLEVRRRGVEREGGGGGGGEREKSEVEKKLSAQEKELDEFLLNLKDMAEGLDSVLQEGAGEREKGEGERGGEGKGEGEGEHYSTLKHRGPPRKSSTRYTHTHTHTHCLQWSVRIESDLGTCKHYRQNKRFEIYPNVHFLCTAITKNRCFSR